jgi:hypothetical protein
MRETLEKELPGTANLMNFQLLISVLFCCQVAKLSEFATIPTRGSARAAG